MRQCVRCKRIYPLTDFYKNSRYKDNRDTRCKYCCRKYLKERRSRYDATRKAYREKHIEKIATKEKEYEQLPAIKARRSGYMKKYYNDPRLHLRFVARSKVNHQIRSGRLKPQPCVECGNAKTQAHHPDYTKPLWVVWLCKKHHTEVHQWLRKKEKRLAPKKDLSTNT